MTKFKFSPQAAALMRQVKQWNDDQFFSWLQRNGVPIGSSCVMDYLMSRDERERGKTIAPREVMFNGSSKR